MAPKETGNFSFLEAHADALYHPASAAEQLFPHTPKACLSRLRVFGEKLAKRVAENLDVPAARRVDRQYDRIRALEEHGTVSRSVASALHEIRQAGNKALHDDEGDAEEAETQLRNAWRVARWYGRKQGLDDIPSSFTSPPEPSGPSENEEPPPDSEEKTRSERELHRRIRALESKIADAADEEKDGTDQDQARQERRIEQLEQQLATFKEQLKEEREGPADASSKDNVHRTPRSALSRGRDGFTRALRAMQSWSRAAVSGLWAGLRRVLMGLRLWVSRLVKTGVVIAAVGILIFYTPTLYSTGASLLPEKARASIPSPDSVRSTHRSILTEERRRQVRSAVTASVSAVASEVRSVRNALGQDLDEYLERESETR